MHNKTFTIVLKKTWNELCSFCYIIHLIFFCDYMFYLNIENASFVLTYFPTFQYLGIEGLVEERIYQQVHHM